MKCTFSKKILKMFLWRRQMQFWQACRKFSAKSWIVIVHIPKVIKSSVIFSEKNPQTFFWTRRIQFWQACQKFWLKVRKYLWNYFVFTKKVSPSSKRQKVCKFYSDGNWTRQNSEYAIRNLLSESKTETLSLTPFPASIIWFEMEHVNWRMYVQTLHTPLQAPFFTA